MICRKSKAYEPMNDPCRVCGQPAPHDWRNGGERVLIVCANPDCRALLESESFPRIGWLIARRVTR